MKNLIRGVGILLVWVASPVAAYEIDVHYYATYVLARAAGYAAEDSRIIASANQGMDENAATHAALEFDTGSKLPSPVRQSRKNFNFHCFSTRADVPQSINEDVRDQESRLHDRVANPLTTQSLIALGVELHCNQDAYSHNGYGGTCNGHPGSCTGHAFDSAIDTPAKRFNPDHPAVKSWGLTQALEATLKSLQSHLSTPATGMPISWTDLQLLSNQLRTANILNDISDAQRQRCNRARAASWLRDMFTKYGGARTEPHRVSEADCGSLSIVEIPNGEWPWLDADAKPRGVFDKRYDLVNQGAQDISLTEITVEQVSTGGAQARYTVSVKFAGAGQLLAAAAVHVLLIPEDLRLGALGIAQEISKNDLGATLTFTAPEYVSFAAEVALRPLTNSLWPDRQITNDRGACAVVRSPTRPNLGAVNQLLEGRTSRRCDWKSTPAPTVTIPNSPTNLQSQ